jgi:FAD/FMN-containing dehydrogenase
VDSVFVLPGSPDYESVRRPAIGRFQDVRPCAVARCATPVHVADAISYARAGGFAVAVRSGGHCFAGRSSTEGVVIDVTSMGSVSVSGSTVTVGAGTRLGRLYDALAEHGVTVPAGCGPTVGIAGLTLGGGLGILGRRYGLTCDALRAARVVLADGREIECDEQRDADLFWALRGGGNGDGNRLGVVTSLTFATVPAPEATGFHLTWSADRAAAVVGAWQAWAPDSPDEVAASLVISTADAADAADSAAARPPVVSVFGAVQGTDAEDRLDELVAGVGTAPASAEYRPGSFRATKRYLTEVDVHGTGEPELPATEVHSYSRSEFFDRPLPSDTIAALVGHLVADRRPGESRELDFTPWGGAYNRLARDATAFPHRGERFLLKQSVVVPPAIPADPARRWLDGSWGLTHPYGTGGVYPNFPDPDLADPAGAYYGVNRARLEKVKAAYDPENVF